MHVFHVTLPAAPEPIAEPDRPSATRENRQRRPPPASVMARARCSAPPVLRPPSRELARLVADRHDARCATGSPPIVNPRGEVGAPLHVRQRDIVVLLTRPARPSPARLAPAQPVTAVRTNRELPSLAPAQPRHRLLTVGWKRRRSAFASATRLQHGANHPPLRLRQRNAPPASALRRRPPFRSLAPPALPGPGLPRGLVRGPSSLVKTTRFGSRRRRQRGVAPLPRCARLEVLHPLAAERAAARGPPAEPLAPAQRATGLLARRRGPPAEPLAPAQRATGLLARPARPSRRAARASATRHRLARAPARTTR
jgi:hypothetical protein